MPVRTHELEPGGRRCVGETPEIRSVTVDREQIATPAHRTVERDRHAVGTPVRMERHHAALSTDGWHHRDDLLEIGAVRVHRPDALPRLCGHRRSGHREVDEIGAHGHDPLGEQLRRDADVDHTGVAQA